MKRVLTICLAFCCSLLVNAQATDLVIDNQAPGWLSSKINYGDQQTVKNLKVTGYINKTDLNFIGTLTQLSLNGIIDLSEATIVENTWNGSFKKSWVSDYTYHLQKLIMPKNLKAYCEPEGEMYGVGNTKVDTLVFETAITCIDNPFWRKIELLELGESIDSINSHLGVYNNISSVSFPKSLKYIADEACYNLITDFSKTNIKEFPSLENMGNMTFVVNPNATPKLPYNKASLPDTIRFPQIKSFYISAFDYKEDMHIYFGKNLETLCYKPDVRNGSVYWAPSLNKVYFHIRTSSPPAINLSTYNGSVCLPHGLTLCIPKGMKDAYKAALPYGSNYYILIEEDIPIEQIVLQSKELTMEVGEKVIIEANLLPECVTEKTIVWSVADNNIVSISQSGEVTALSYGETYVYASSLNGEIQDTCKITVRAHAESVSIEPSTIVLSNKGDTQLLKAVILPDNAVDISVTWKSLNEQVCTISQDGVVTATGPGTTNVTVTTVDGGHTATCSVKVIQHVADLSLEKHSLSLKVGGTEMMYTRISPTTAEDKTITWSSSNEQIAIVDTNGNVKAIKAGKAWIKAVSVDNAEAKDSCKVTVTQPVTGITISQESIRLTNIGENKQLEATVLPEDASNKEVKWKSSNESICMVANGKVIATGFGTSVVMVTTVDGGFMASCTVTVESENTSIESVDVSVSDNPVYNMMGRKVTVLEKGRLYIRNGKKFIAK